ncbi:PH domain-containing protein [Salana multivorans]
MSERPVDEGAVEDGTGVDSVAGDDGHAAAPGVGGASEPTWRRVARITPLLTAWKVAAALIAVVLFQVVDDLARAPLPLLTLVGLVAAGIAVGILISLVYAYLAWRRLTYAITDDAVLMRSGVVFRRERASRLTRIQTVEVTQPILGRLFGYAAVTIESAGAADANLRLAYLTQDEARLVRNEILARAAGLDVSAPVQDAPAVPGVGGEEGPGVVGAAGEVLAVRGAEAGSVLASASVAPVAAGPVVPEAPEREVLHVPPGRLIGSVLLSGAMVGIVVTAVAMAIAAGVTGSREFIFGWLAGLLGTGSYLWSRFAGEFGFRLATSPDGLRVRSGLLETRAQTIPPGRIQGIGISQGPLWRMRGWWRVQLSLATGIDMSDGSGGAPDVLLPVGSRDDVLTVVRLAMPGMSETEVEALVTGMLGNGPEGGWTVSPDRARWIDPFAWRRNGFQVLDPFLAIRRGRIFRRVDLVPHERTQSLGVSQGPFERRLRLVSFQAHSSGDLEPTLPHVDPAIAAELLWEQAERARAARRSAGPEQWMRQTSASPSSPVEPTSPGSPAPPVEPIS